MGLKDVSVFGVFGGLLEEIYRFFEGLLWLMYIPINVFFCTLKWYRKLNCYVIEYVYIPLQ